MIVSVPITEGTGNVCVCVLNASVELRLLPLLREEERERVREEEVRGMEKKDERKGRREDDR